MRSIRRSDPLVTGLGVVTGFGQGKATLLSGLRGATSLFKPLARPGRAVDGQQWLGIELPELDIASPHGRTMSLSAKAALAAIAEAWDESALDAVDPARIGLIVGGSNVQQRELVQAQQKFARTGFVLPSYAMAFMDSDICGICTEAFGIRGMAHTVGGASASGQLAVIHATQAVASGQVDVCIAVGALMDISAIECGALSALGAMGSERYAEAPASACRPFDRQADGFIYGESCAALVIEREETCGRRGAVPYARVAGSGVRMDANRHPNSSADGEAAAIECALQAAAMTARDVDYVNPHGSGSAAGDANEVEALRRMQLGHAYVNTTKSILGHGLTAAGAVEIAATLLQMRAGFLHPSRNLLEPISDDLRWVRDQVVDHRPAMALALSYGFGGINTALCLENLG